MGAWRRVGRQSWVLTFVERRGWVVPSVGRRGRGGPSCLFASRPLCSLLVEDAPVWGAVSKGGFPRFPSSKGGFHPLPGRSICEDPAPTPRPPGLDGCAPRENRAHAQGSSPACPALPVVVHGGPFA